MNVIKKMKLKSLLKQVADHHDKREAGQAPELWDEINALMAVGEFYADIDPDKDLPHADLLSREAYRAAALLGHSEAQYRCGLLFLELGHFWSETRRGALASPDQDYYIQYNYKEALNYLIQAQGNGHALAQRQHGMCYIHGWGVEQDTQQGYQLVIESIDVEGSWDKATEIFQRLGLNSTEFFSMLGALRQQKNSE